MSFQVEVTSDDRWASEAASHVDSLLPESGPVVITGGETAKELYGQLDHDPVRWQDIDVYFSDERSVDPGDTRSNFKMADENLLALVRPRSVHRMKGELDPGAAAEDYGIEVQAGLDDLRLAILGLGADAHIAALFPGSLALSERKRSCVPVERPDGLAGISLTMPVLLGAESLVILATGRGKAEAVARSVNGDESPDRCPALGLRDHPHTTLLVDRAAATLL